MHPGVLPRIRGRRLMHFRKVHMQSNPLCPLCEAQGITRLGTELDHTQALMHGGTDDKRDPFANRQLICAEHHREKTALDQGKRARPSIGFDGLPANSGEVSAPGGVQKKTPKRSPETAREPSISFFRKTRKQ